MITTPLDVIQKIHEKHELVRENKNILHDAQYVDYFLYIST